MDKFQSTLSVYDARLTHLQMTVLRFIGEHPNCIQSDIVERFKDRKVSTLVEVVDLLKTIGVVRVSGVSKNKWGDEKETLLASPGWQKLLEYY